jgi:hypothetical protein
MMPVHQINNRRLARMRREMPPYWAPILEALEHHGTAVLILRPQSEPFRVTPDQPMITVIGDDPADADAQGPHAFHVPSLFNHLQRCTACVVIAGEAQVEHYATAASVPILLEQNVVLIETQPGRQDEWTQLALAAGIGRLMIVTPYVPPGTDVGLGRPVGETIH